MYFFLRDYAQVMEDNEYDGKYDDLLYFYAYNYALIQNEYINGRKKGLEFRKIEGYIHSEKEQKTEE